MDVKLLAAMAAHVDAEERASRLYRQLSSWCEWQSWIGSAGFFRSEAKEEQEHAQQWQDYVLDRGGYVKLGPLAAVQPGTESDPLMSCFAAALAAEQSILSEIEKLTAWAIELGDADAVRFMQKYTDAGVQQIRDLQVYVVTLQRAGSDIAALQTFDRGLGGK